jgi:hypothetical protein
MVYGQGQRQQKKVVIRIVQEESEMLGEFQTNLLLKKKQFKILVGLQNIEGVYVFASIRDSVYRFKEEGPIRDFIYLPLLSMREDTFNLNKELNIAETGWSYWYYKPSAKHSFQRKVTEIDRDNNFVIGTKIIKNLYDINAERTIRIKDIDRPLYLFFIAVSEYDKDGNPTKELMRRKIKIDWKDDD